MAPAAAIIGAVAAVIGTAGSIYFGVKSAQSAKEAQKAERKRLRSQQRRQRRQAEREARIRRATVVNAGSQLGATGGSALAGGLASLESQVGTNLAFGNVQSNLANSISRNNQDATTFSGLASLSSDLSGLGATIYSNRERIGNFYNKATS